MARVLDKVREYFANTYEEAKDFYIYNVTEKKIAYAKNGSKFCDHWEDLDSTDADLAKFVRDAFKAAEPKKVLKAAEPKKAKAEPQKKSAKPKKEKPDMTGAKQLKNWRVNDKWAQSPKGRFWKVTKITKAGWNIESNSGCKGRLTLTGDWVAA